MPEMMRQANTGATPPPAQSPPTATDPAPPTSPPAGAAQGSESPQKKVAQKDPTAQTITIKPHLLFSLLYQGFVIGFLVAVGYLSIALVKSQLDVDIIAVIGNAMGEIATTSSSLGVTGMSMQLFERLEVLLIFFLFQLVLLALLQIPLFNKKWLLHHDRVDIRGGLFSKDFSIKHIDVIAVNYKRYLPGLDFGKLTLEYTGGEGRIVELPYVLWAQQATAIIYDEVARRRVEQPSPQASATPQQPSQQPKS